MKKKIIDKIIIAVAVVILALCVGIAGTTDADEYIEVNSKPVARWIR